MQRAKKRPRKRKEGRITRPKYERASERESTRENLPRQSATDAGRKEAEVPGGAGTSLSVCSLSLSLSLSPPYCLPCSYVYLLMPWLGLFSPLAIYVTAISFSLFTSVPEYKTSPRARGSSRQCELPDAREGEREKEFGP